MVRRFKLIPFLVFFFLFISPFFFKSYSSAAFTACNQGDTAYCSGSNSAQCVYFGSPYFAYGWNIAACPGGQVCAGAGGCYIPCTATCQLSTDVCNDGFGGHNYLGDPYCGATGGNSHHGSCCNTTCNINSCAQQWCDQYCGLYGPACGANGCMQGSLIQSNSASCNGIPYNGSPLSCPTGGGPSAPVPAPGTASCTGSTGTFPFTWDPTGQNTSGWGINVLYCDATNSPNCAPSILAYGPYPGGSYGTFAQGQKGVAALIAGHNYAWLLHYTTNNNATYTDVAASNFVCGTVPANGVCDASHYACNSTGASVNNVDGPTQWTWTCNGTNGGSNTACTENKPTFNVTGQVYVDTGKNGQLDPAVDYAYTGSSLTVTICAGNQPGGCSSPVKTLTTNPANGTFTATGVTSLLSGSYTAILALPSSYKAISPKPPIMVFTVGASCQATAPASCDANGNIANLNFGISNSFPWMQVVGGDIISNGFTDNIPLTADLACSGGAYASAVGAGGTPGVVNTEASSANFGQGAASTQNWVVGGLGAGNYPYVYNMPISNQAHTSFTNLSYLVKQSNIHTNSLDSYCSGGVSNCTLPTTTASFPSGVYTVSNLTLGETGGTYTFPSDGKYVILVNGILTINTKVFVPNGSYALFSASDNIDVAPTVGDTSHATTTNLEGFYSTDKSFYAQSLDTNGQGANCGTNNEDLRLNVAGAIVVNADTTNNGGFYYQRDMCTNDLKCPVFTITERPDFILNSPTFLMFPRRVWQEVAP